MAAAYSSNIPFTPGQGGIFGWYSGVNTLKACQCTDGPTIAVHPKPLPIAPATSTPVTATPAAIRLPLKKFSAGPAPSSSLKQQLAALGVAQKRT